MRKFYVIIIILGIGLVYTMVRMNDLEKEIGAITLQNSTEGVAVLESRLESVSQGMVQVLEQTNLNEQNTKTLVEYVVNVFSENNLIDSKDDKIPPSDNLEKSK